MLGEKGAGQRRALEATLARAVDLAIEQRVDLVLIAGDLFDSPKPSPATVELVARELRRLDDARIRTALVAGNHDVGEDGYIGGWDRLRGACPNLIGFGRDIESHTFQDLDLVLIGRSPEPGSGTSPLVGWTQRRTARFAIGLTHGSTYRAGVVEGAGVIHPQEIRDLGLDYLALGDWHSACEILGSPHAAWYAGSPELLAYDQEGAGHILLVEISEPGQARVAPQRIGRRRYRRIEIDASTTDEQGVRRIVQETADPDAVCDVIVSGLVPVSRIMNVRSIEDDLAERFFRLRITNRTQVWLDDEQMAQLPEDTVLGRFVRLMRTRIAQAPEPRQPVLEEALQVGVALLQGREVLS